MNGYLRKRLQAAARVVSEIGAEVAGVLRRDVERCAERARFTKGLGAAWSVTEAMDLGNQVILRFDRTTDVQDWDGFIVRVNKATGRVTAKAT